MTTNEEIKKDIQELNQGSPFIELYSLDATVLGDTVYYFTPGVLGGSYIKFNGVSYNPMPVEASGFEYDGEGKMPRPKIQVANINLTFVATINAYDDLVGATVTRTRTFQKYLDGQSEADPTAQFPHDTFIIERKTKQNKFMIEWELKAAIDIETVLFPRGQVLEVCTRRYRSWDSDESIFVYPDVSIVCPYTGSNYFNDEGDVTTEDLDKCGKKLIDCKLRYPLTTDVLPGYFCPGIGKIGYPYR